MSKANEYINRLDELTKRGEFKKARRVYEEIGKKDYRTLQDKGKRYLSMVPDEIKRYRGDVQAIAYHLMEQEHDFAGDVLLGAKLYEKLGKGKRAVPRLVKRFEEISKKSGTDRILLYEYLKDAKEFIKRNLEEKPQKEKGLESRIAVFVLFIAAGIALSAASLGMTGWAISGLIQTTPGLLGILFFIVGLVGMFFWFRKR